MLRIGLTGGIGAGKSALSATFAECGGIIVDGDVIAREVVQPGTEGLASLVEAFGDDILQPDGSLDRPALAAKAFRDDEARQKLNAIVHPLVGKRRAEIIASVPRGRGCRRRHSAAGGIRHGAVVPVGCRGARRRRAAGAAAGRATRHGRGRRPRQDRGCRPTTSSVAPSPTSGWTTRAAKRIWSSGPATSGTTGSCRSRTT